MAAASPKAKSPAAPPPADADLEPVCPICLQAASDDDGPLLHYGCACRGSAGRVHFDCAVGAAKAKPR